jgi:hypothetical protein
MSGEHGGQVDQTKSIRQDTAVKQIMQDFQDDIRCMWPCAKVLEGCVHMLCSWGDRNDLILELLQSPLIYYGGVHKDRSNEPLLIEYNAVHFAGWSNVSPTLC